MSRANPNSNLAHLTIDVGNLKGAERRHIRTRAVNALQITQPDHGQRRQMEAGISSIG
jgi:hypothetical protein